MNPGRGATRLGNDAMPIWVDVPGWLSRQMRVAFEVADISFEVREGYIRSEGVPDHCLDRFTFPAIAGGDVRGSDRERATAIVQRVVDSVSESRPRDC